MAATLKAVKMMKIGTALGLLATKGNAAVQAARATIRDYARLGKAFTDKHGAVALAFLTVQYDAYVAKTTAGGDKAKQDEAARKVWREATGKSFEVKRRGQDKVTKLAPTSGAEYIRLEFGIGHGPDKDREISKVRSEMKRAATKYAEVNKLKMPPSAGVGRRRTVAAASMGAMVVKMKSAAGKRVPVTVTEKNLTEGFSDSKGKRLFSALAVKNAAVAALGQNVLAILAQHAKADAVRAVASRKVAQSPGA